MSGRVGGGRIGHRDLVSYGSPIGPRQPVGNQDDVAHRGVVDHLGTNHSGHPISFRPGDGGQFDGVAGGDAQPAGGNLAQTDLPVPQPLPEPVGPIGRLVQRLAVLIPGCDANDQA